jgi:hypothetical protein
MPLLGDDEKQGDVKLSCPPSQPEERRFDDRQFFDRVDYIAFRLFLLAMALAAMYSALKSHL